MTRKQPHHNPRRNSNKRREPSPARSAALRILLKQEAGEEYADTVLQRELERIELSDEDRRLLQELVFGTIRMHGRLDYVLAHHLTKGLESIPVIVLWILRLAAYELLFLDRIPAYATISEAVELVAAERSLRGLRGVVNGVLRNISREPDQPPLPAITENPAQHLSVAESYPKELVQRWIELWGLERASSLCRAGNKRPLMTARVMLSKCTREDALTQFTEAGVNVEIDDSHPAAIRFTSSANPAGLSVFKNGLLQIQDVAAMFVTPLLQPCAGERIWDVCAAPGGKTTHLADLSSDEASVLATDKSDKRLQLLRDSISRLQLGSVTVKAYDPLVSDESPDDGHEGFDGILLDVPCSGWGTMARRVDLRWRFRLDDGPRLADQAFRLLQRCWRELRPGGRLVYSTCTLNPRENEDVIQRFLESETSARMTDAGRFVPVNLHEVLLHNGQLHIWPGTVSSDGAFACRLDKQSA